MLAQTEAKIPTAAPAEKPRLQERAEVLRECITPKSGNPALGLAAYGATPANAATARQRRVSLHLLPGLPFAISAQLLHPCSNGGEVVSSAARVAQLLHAGFDGREIVGSARSVHGVSSHPLGLV